MVVRKKILSVVMATAAIANFACSKNENNDGAEKARLEKAATEGQTALTQAKELEASSKKAIEEAKAAQQKAEAAEAAAKAEQEELKVSKTKQDSDHQSAMELLEQERGALITERRELEEARVKVQAEIEAKKKDLTEIEATVATAKSNVEALEAQAKAASTTTTEAADKLEAAKKALTEAEERSAEAKKSKEEADARLADVAKREVDSVNREARVNAAAAAWKDVFSQYKMTDIFDKIQANDEMMLFQVSMVGYSTKAGLDAARAKLSAANQDPSLKNARKLVPDVTPQRTGRFSVSLPTGNSVYDSYLIKTTPKNLKAVQDEITKMSDADSKNSLLFVIVRLVENTRVSLIMDVMARDKLKADSTEKVLSLKLGSRAVEGVDLSKVSLSKPGQFFLGAGKQDVCNTVTADCLKAMVDGKALSSEYIVETMNADYDDQKQRASAQTLLRQMMYLSTQQIVQDLTTIKGEQLIGWQRRINEQGEIDREFTVVDGFFKKLIGMENRYPIVQEIRLKYAITMMVSTPRTGMVPLDSVFGAHRNSVMGRQLVSVNQIQREYEFPLPLAEIQQSIINFPVEAKAAHEAAKKDKLTTAKAGQSAAAKEEGEYASILGETLGFQQEMVRKLK